MSWFKEFFGIKKTSMSLTKDETREMKSNRPFVKIVGDNVDPQRGIKIELDWNTAFIEYLKSNGITGTSDEQIVQKWIAMLYKDLIDTMADAQINEYQ